MTAADYLSLLQALLPPGKAWTRDPDAVLTALLVALAAELARVDARVDALQNETDPRTVGELLEEWETVFGLPDTCTGQLPTLAQRRMALHGRVTAVGGASPAYFIAVAAAVGYTVTIDEQVDADPYKWRVNAPATTVTEFRAGSGRAGEPLRSWGNQLLECAIIRLCPAHTQVIFAYGP